MTITDITSTGQVQVLVDGSNLRGSLAAIGYSGIDIGAMRRWAAAYGRPTIEWFQGAYPGVAPFHQVLRANGVRVHAPQPKVLPDGHRKADCDVAITVAALRNPGAYSTVVLVSGDGDFEPLVGELVDRAVRVVIVAQWGLLAPELLQHVEPEDFIPLDRAVVEFGYRKAS